MDKPMDEPIKKKSAKEQMLALHKTALAKAAEAERLRNQRGARRHAGAPPEDEDTQAQAMVRRYCDWEDYAGMWEPKNTGYSDYSGCMVERANAEYWTTNYGIFEQVHGGHGTVWTGIPHDNLVDLDEDVYERLEQDFINLEDYPCLDDELLSEMEFRAKQEYWESYGRKELRKELIQQAGYDVLAHLAAVYMSDEDLDHLFQEGDMDQQLEIETGGSVYFRVERAAEDIPVDVLIEMGTQEPRIAGAEKKALLKQWPAFLDLVAEVIGPDYADKLAGLSDDHAYGLFRKLNEKYGEDGLWSLDEDQHDDPSENLDLDLNDVKRALVHLNDELVRASRPEDPRQLRLPLVNGEATTAQEIVSTLLEGFREKKAAFIAAGADPQAVDHAITQFRALRTRRVLTTDEANIDLYATFEDLQAIIQQAIGREHAPVPTRRIEIRDDAELIYDDEKVLIVVPHTYEASVFYGEPNWCVSRPNDKSYFLSYRRDLAKHHMLLFKNRPSTDIDYKICLTVYPGRRMAHDAEDHEIPLSDFIERSGGFDPNDPMFTPWDWHKMPPHERWKVAKREPGMTFDKFIHEIDQEAWDTLAKRLPELKRLWKQGRQAEAEKNGLPMPDEAKLEAEWPVFWHDARMEALEKQPADDPVKLQTHQDYLDALAAHIVLAESRSAIIELANLLLERVVKEGAIKDWIIAL